VWSDEKSDLAVSVSGLPRYGEIIKKTTGFFLRNPKAADPQRVVYE
jgi:hypothetical protein